MYLLSEYTGVTTVSWWISARDW